jgi:hypothetical protein
MSVHNFQASKELNDRAKALGVDVQVDITIPRPAEPLEEAKLLAAVTAAHIVILESLEASGFRLEGVTSEDPKKRSTPLDVLSKDTIGALAEMHIRRFTNLLAVKHRGPSSVVVRREECERYLAIWSLVREHNRDGVPLEPTGRNEILEALASCDYNDVITANELEAVKKWRGE